MDAKKHDDKLTLIAERIKRQNRLEEQEIRERVYQAHQEVDRLVRLFLETDPDLERVVLFGSLAEERVFSLTFDIDLAVRSDRFLQLVACGLKSPFQVDVVDLDRTPEHIRISIQKYGKVLYEKEKQRHTSSGSGA